MWVFGKKKEKEMSTSLLYVIESAGRFKRLELACLKQRAAERVTKGWCLKETKKENTIM